MPLVAFPGKYRPAELCKIKRIPITITNRVRNYPPNDVKIPIKTPECFEVFNGLTGMNKSVNIKLMKHIGIDSEKIRNVFLCLINFYLR
jgi:hypothetical protein